jgi:hypothetical protein
MFVSDAVKQGAAHPKFGGGVSSSTVHPAVLVTILILSVLICVGPRKKALAAFLVAGLLIPIDQVLLIGPAHFPTLRILVIFGIVRLLKDRASSKQPLFSGGINKLDLAVIWLSIFTAVNGILLFLDIGAVINQVGALYASLGAYFLLRFLIRDEEDVVLGIQILAYIAAVVAVVMVYEITTGHNPYAMLGGANTASIATLVLRDGKFRAQGPFGHSLLAGTFGATLIPLFVALWWKGREHRKLVVIGILSSTVITLASNSSTPILGYAAGVLALCLWPLRKRMRMIRRGIVLVLICLHIVMKGPVWSLIEKIDFTGGSSSFHRYQLIDQCIRHFSDWWLIGVKDTSVWGWDMWDTANLYVSTCDNSGLIPFVLLIAILVYGFKYIGVARCTAEPDKNRARFIWAIGSALFAHAVAVIGISYWDQMQVAWSALLVMISAIFVTQRSKRIGTPPLTPSGNKPPVHQEKDQLLCAVS